MAKRYKITESQFKQVLESLQLNEAELNEFGSFDDQLTPQDDPNYALVEIKTEEYEGQQVVAFFWEEEGSGRIFKGSLDLEDVARLGENPQSLVAEFQATKQVNRAVEDAAWATAEYLHDGQDDSDFYGN